MNIFAVSSDIVECSRALDDLRLNKMIIETAQLLSTALHFHNSPYAKFVYKKTHINHPCSVWVRATRQNYSWLVSYLLYLNKERMSRGFKSHKSFDKCYTYLSVGLTDIPDGPQTSFANCTPYKNHGTFDAYKLTLIDKWAKDKRPPKWTNAQKPTWA